MQFRTYFDKNHTDLFQFRSKLVMENGGTDEYLLQEMKRETIHQKWQQLSLGSDAAEEVYKFGFKKWKDANFHSFETVVYNNAVVSFSACEPLNPKVLRAVMLLYTLTSYRSKVRNHVFSEDGFVHRHLQQAQKDGYEALVLCIYPHTSKLKAHADNLAIFKRSPSRSSQPYLQRFEDLGIHTVKNVEQRMVGLKMNGSASWPSLLPEFINE